MHSFFSLSTVRSLSVLVMLSLGAWGCSAEDETNEDPYATTDGDDEFSGSEASAADELVTEGQLNGRSLPASTLSFTYDDGPGPRSRELADYLAAEGVPATFFVNGAKFPGRESTLRAIAAGGHLLANHTQTHKQLTKITAAQVREEVGRTHTLLTEYIPNGPWLIRAPYGAWNKHVADALNASPELSHYVGSIFWDIGGSTTATSAADWDCWGSKKYSVEKCADLYFAEITQRNRGIILMHDIHGKTIELTKLLVPRLKAEGYRFARLDAVPAIASAIVAASAEPTEPVPGEEQTASCRSATLGRTVAHNTCVQAASTRKWNICKNGDWKVIAEPTAECVETYGLGQ